MNLRTIICFVPALTLTGFTLQSHGQEVLVPDPGLNAAIRETLQRTTGRLTVQDLLILTNLDASQRNIRSVEGLDAARNLVSLDLQRNELTNFALPSAMTKLALLDVSVNQLTSFTVPAEWTALTHLALSKNSLTNITLPENLNRLVTLSLTLNRLTHFTLPAGLTNLAFLHLNANQLTNVALPAELSHLESLDLSGNQLTDFVVPAGLTNLTALFLSENQLTNLTLPPDLLQLTSLDLALLDFFDPRPLATLVLPEPLAATNLAETVATLREEGTEVFTYPLTVQLVVPQILAGEFQFAVDGPPGVYAILGSTDLDVWTELTVATNTLGFIRFSDPTTHLSPQKFYRARSRSLQ